MRGAGTRMGITTNRSAAILLDVTRLVSRTHVSTPTGVDRVELAYLNHLADERSGDLFLLARTALGVILIGPEHVNDVRSRFTRDVPWDRPDLIGRLFRRGDPARAGAEASLRRMARARASVGGVARMLRRHLPMGFTYFNVGHSNLSRTVLNGVRQGGCGDLAVLVHDTIPLDHPEWTRAGQSEVFARKLTRAGMADRLIANSNATAADIRRHLGPDCPPITVAPLGVDRPIPDAGAVPDDVPRDRPYFVHIGTIEPRKNIDLLLDVWDRYMTAPDAPRLILIGRRGWADADLFKRLDSYGPDSTVIERADLPDGAVFAILSQAEALLFPSLAEGYGLPPIEAATLGVVPVVSDLEIYTETIGDFAVYVNTDDAYSWANTIKDLGMRKPRLAPFTPPTWQAHFRKVFDAS